jgi:tetratricopeptide (TPR) repeat protein
MKTSFRWFRAGVIGVAALAGAAGPGGCQSSQKSPKVRVITIESDAERLAEAQRLAASAQTMREPAKAIERYRQAVKAYPDFPAAWNNMGVLLLREGRFREAAEAFLAAGDRAPSDPRPLYNLGLSWDRAGYLVDALDHYSEALNRDPNYLPALRGAVRAERRLGRANAKTLERIRTALMSEDDAQWREYFELLRSWAEEEVAFNAGLPPSAASANGP